MEHSTRLNSRAKLQGVPLPDAERRLLCDFIRRNGEPLVLAATGISRLTCARACAGLGIRNGSAALIRRGLEKLEAEDARERDAQQAAELERGGRR